MEFSKLSSSRSTDSPATPDHDPTDVNIIKRRISSGSSILSKIPFLRPATSDGGHDSKPRHDEPNTVPTSPPTAAPPISPISETIKQTRRRKGSLRKVALLSRGAQRERRENRPLTVETMPQELHDMGPETGMTPVTAITDGDRGLGGAYLRHERQHPVSPDSFVAGTMHPDQATLAPQHIQQVSGQRVQPLSGPDVAYASTTDDEDVLHISKHVTSLPGLSQSSGSESYVPHRLSFQRRRSAQRAKSPLSYGGLSSTHIPSQDDDWDYSETEWWGWVVLFVTWFVFVIGMGSCLGVWSWAWDVGTTPYAPPELEDDPTLPIVGYYPALAILSCIMAWVWVVVAWVGMKYFRHAKIGGD
jgi:hypothetical protein